jgi:HSP20 family molecular chaperone IbpA
MNAEKDVAPQGAQSEPADSSGSLALRPAVDIFENGDAIRLFADLPGVSEESLQLEVDDRTLTIQGDIGIYPQQRAGYRPDRSVPEKWPAHRDPA